MSVMMFKSVPLEFPLNPGYVLEVHGCPD